MAADAVPVLREECGYDSQGHRHQINRLSTLTHAVVADVASAQQVFASRQKLGDDIIGYAHSIKINVLGRLGDLLTEMPKATGTRGKLPAGLGRGKKNGGSKRNRRFSDVPTYADLGLDKKTARRCAAARGVADCHTSGDRRSRTVAHGRAARDKVDRTPRGTHRHARNGRAGQHPSVGVDPLPGDLRRPRRVLDVTHQRDLVPPREQQELLETHGGRHSRPFFVASPPWSPMSPPQCGQIVVLGAMGVPPMPVSSAARASAAEPGSGAENTI